MFVKAGLHCISGLMNIEVQDLWAPVLETVRTTLAREVPPHERILLQTIVIYVLVLKSGIPGNTVLAPSS